ncbi:MAG: biotin synthase BioB, partial [Pseudomonadota bacterium]
NQVRKQYVGTNLELCGIVNAKSGMCNQDCKFCAQSMHHNTGIQVYGLLTVDEMVAAAQKSKDDGAQNFGIVTSGNRLTQEELNNICQASILINKKVGINVCASLGALTQDQLRQLSYSGVLRYHHNIETSERFYPQIVSTHNFSERIETIRLAKKIGLQVCSGGIIGLGETWQDRIDMAKTLAQLDVDAVPINILIPIKGTAIGDIAAVSKEDVLRTIAIFRIILQNKTIKLAAGRETVFAGDDSQGFLAGANGMLIGGYLTVKGRQVCEDLQLVEDVHKLWSV